MNRACVVVAILLTPAIASADDPPTGRFVVGAGFSSDESFIAHAGIAQDDLFGTGQKLSLTADLSMLRQDFLVAHEVPDLLGSGLDLRSELYSRRRVYDTFARESSGGALTLGHQLDRTTRIYARYRFEHVAMNMNAGYFDQAARTACPDASATARTRRSGPASSTRRSTRRSCRRAAAASSSSPSGPPVRSAPTTSS
jgi:outer membrane protein assembly factor BamA